MKKYQLTLVVREKTDREDMHSIDVVEGDTMIELLAQFNIVIAGMVKKVTEMKDRNRHGYSGDDDIPF